MSDIPIFAPHQTVESLLYILYLANAISKNDFLKCLQICEDVPEGSDGKQAVEYLYNLVKTRDEKR